MSFKGFEEVEKRLKGFLARQEMKKEITIERAEIVKMVQSQLARGLDGNGEQVYLIRNGQRHLTYSPRTIKNKRARGSGLSSITDHITNYMSGNFYRSLYVFVFDNGEFEIRSRSGLIEIIKKRSGEDIIELSPESERFLFQNKIAPDLQKTIDELFEK